MGERGRGRGVPRGGGHGYPMPPGRGLPFGLAAMFGRGPAVRRGDVRSAVLGLLAESEMHGYQIMQELGERSGGTWRPSAGSVYPTLQQLQDEGLVRSDERDGRRVFSLTERGRTAAAKAMEAGAPWEVDRDQAGAELNRLVMQVVRAVMQVRQVGGPAAIAEARRVLVQTRRDMYRLLAEDDLEDETGPEADASEEAAAAASGAPSEEPAIEPADDER